MSFDLLFSFIAGIHNLLCIYMLWTQYKIQSNKDKQTSILMKPPPYVYLISLLIGLISFWLIKNIYGDTDQLNIFKLFISSLFMLLLSLYVWFFVAFQKLTNQNSDPN